MLDAHAQLGIAQIIFWAPIVPLAIFRFIRNWRYRPRMAWWPPVPLSLMRVAGGAIMVVRNNDPYNLGLIIAAIVLLNVGAIPLIVNELGFVRAILMDNFSHVPWAPKVVKALRLCFIAAVVLLVTGGSMVSEAPGIAHYLSLAGYCVFAAVLLVVITTELFLLTKRANLIPSSRRILFGGLVASPFLIVRNIYGILGYAINDYTDGVNVSKFSPVFGSAEIFAVMGLLMEYIAVCIYLWVGFTIPPDRGGSDVRQNLGTSEHMLDNGAKADVV